MVHYYTLSNFEIRRDVIRRLRASLQVTLKRACFAAIPKLLACFMVNRLKYAMTSRLISKLDRVESRN